MVDVLYNDLIGAPIIQNSTYHYGPQGGSSGDPLSKLLKVGNTGGIRPKKTVDGRNSAYVVLNSTNDSPWDDDHDIANNLITYHGDNNKVERDPSDSTGNKWLKRIFEEGTTSRYGTPMLVFKSIDNEGGSKGIKKFMGVAVPALDDSGKPMYSRDRFGPKNSEYENFVFKMRILDTGSTDLRPWLEMRCNDIEASSEIAPDSWNSFFTSNSPSQHSNNTLGSPSDFMNYLAEKRFYYNPRFIESFLLGLKAKRFMIFCGGTGTGKTKLAQLYCEFIKAEYCIIPVGSNWTDSKFMMGYKNAITGVYEETRPVEIIKKANENPDIPHFIILDEMNLSHIERYFSEFISVMESGEPLVLPNGDEICLKRNIFIIGTMNLDETTYSISPKILDRANVMFFEPADIDSYLNNTSTTLKLEGDTKYLEDCMIPGDLQDYKARQLLSEIGNSDIASFLKRIQTSMTMMNMPLGYRTIDEISRFLYAAWTYEGCSAHFDWRPYLCSQIRMKILPKIHGDITIKKGLIEMRDLLLTDPSMTEAAKEVERMIASLEVRRYTSFIL